MRTKEELRQLQALPLSLKVQMTRRRLRDWIKEYGESGVYLSWSGGKDSTVLRHIIMQDWPEVESVFVNTGLEYPEIQQFVKAAKDRGEPVTILRPAMRFDEVIKKYGYPIIGKKQARSIRDLRNARGQNEATVNLRLTGYNRAGKYCPTMKLAERYIILKDADFDISEQCCDVMKKDPMKRYQKQTGKMPIMATMAAESSIRELQWLRLGCNAFVGKNPKSAPMSFWTNQDVLQYIYLHKIEIPIVYGEVIYKEMPEQMRVEEFTDQEIGCDKLCTTGCDRTGCIFCGFGAHLEKGESRFERLKKTHPRQYEYCISGGSYDENGIWKPDKKGLGMGHVFDELNKIYGDGFIRY